MTWSIDMAIDMEYRQTDSRQTNQLYKYLSAMLESFKKCRKKSTTYS